MNDLKLNLQLQTDVGLAEKCEGIVNGRVRWTATLTIEYL